MIPHLAVLAVLGLSVQMQVAVVQPDSCTCVYGSVTTASEGAVGAPIASAAIELTRAGAPSRHFVSDASGSYRLPPLDAGMYGLRFEREGFIPLALKVRVPAQGSVHLDVTLDPLQPKMQTVEVFAREIMPHVNTRNGAFSAYRPWEITGDQLQRMPSLDFPDVARAIASSPNAQMSPESSGAIHLEGGSADHTLLMVDGIPLYNAIHAGDRSSPIDPDAVSGISVYGEPAARDGGRLTGLVDLRTRTNFPDSEHVRAAIWPAGVRATTILPVGSSGGSATLSARRNYAGSVQGNGKQPLKLGWSDIFGSASIPLSRGTLTAMTFSSADAVNFDAAPEAASADMASSNSLGWTSDARALSWRQETSRHSIEARLWQSGSSVNADWLTTPDHSLRLASRFLQTAASTSFSWRGRTGQTTIGGSLEQLSARYSATSSTFSRGTLAGFSQFTLASAPRVGAAFLEHSLVFAEGLRLTLGERAVSLNGKGLLLEPRVAAAFTANDGVTLSAAFARTHQYSQSLYNEESMADAVASLDIPVAVGSAGVPLASSNSLSGQLAIPIGHTGRITLDGFARRFQGLLLTATSTTAPFATQWFSKGEGSAYGAAITFRRELGNLSVDGRYSLATVWRATASKSYRPAFAPMHNFLLGAGYQLAPHTFLRAAVSMSAGRRTSPVVGVVAWAWQDALNPQREIAGSPQYTTDTFAAGRLPSYLRIDVGVRHDLRLIKPIPGRVALFANIDNLLGRVNAVGVFQNALGSPTLRLPMLPRSLAMGLTWHF